MSHVFAGSVYVYVISHQEDQEVVEKFLFDGTRSVAGSKLTHQTTIGNESDFIQ